MKKISIILTAILSVALVFCNTAKKAQTVQVPKLTYMADIKPIIETNCTPCHIPPRGNKKPYDTYVRVKEDIDAMISRIHRNPGEPGFMPFKHTKLPDSTIKKFEDWKAGGLLEK
jgi:hypothetical protein